MNLKYIVLRDGVRVSEDMHSKMEDAEQEAREVNRRQWGIAQDSDPPRDLSIEALGDVEFAPQGAGVHSRLVPRCGTCSSFG